MRNQNWNWCTLESQSPEIINNLHNHQKSEITHFNKMTANKWELSESVRKFSWLLDEAFPASLFPVYSEWTAVTSQGRAAFSFSVLRSFSVWNKKLCFQSNTKTSVQLLLADGEFRTLHSKSLIHIKHEKRKTLNAWSCRK